MTLKFHFTGRESIAEVKEIVDSEITKNLKKEEVDKTTKVAGKLVKLPDFCFRWFMAIARWADRHGMLSKKLIDASPFHTSCFFTNLKSIKLGYIYHHLYNFGTTTMFMSMGKEKVEPYIENNKELTTAKVLTLGVSLDERVADGLYMAKCLKLLEQFLTNPDTLLDSLPDDGTIPKKIVKKKNKKVKAKKVKKIKAKKVKKIKPLKNKKMHDEKMQKAKLRKEKKEAKKATKE